MSRLNLALKIKNGNREIYKDRVNNTKKNIKNEIDKKLDEYLPNIPHSEERIYRDKAEEVRKILKIRKNTQRHLDFLKYIFKYDIDILIKSIDAFLSKKSDNILDENKNCLNYFYGILNIEDDKKGKKRCLEK